MEEIVEDRAEAKSITLGACFQQCRAEIGNMTVGIFRKLMVSLIESTLMYSDDVLGCRKRLEAIELVKLRAF